MIIGVLWIGSVREIGFGSTGLDGLSKPQLTMDIFLIFQVTYDHGIVHRLPSLQWKLSPEACGRGKLSFWGLVPVE